MLCEGMLCEGVHYVNHYVNTRASTSLYQHREHHVTAQHAMAVANGRSCKAG